MRGRTVAARRTLMVLLLLAAAYVTLAWFVSGHLPASARVEGVSIGGRDPQQATELLQTELAAKATSPVRIELADTGGTVSLDPASAGLTLDVPGTVNALTGFTLDPRRLWRHLTDAVDCPVATDVDEAKLTAVVTERSAALAKPPVDGGVSLAGGVVTARPASDGIALDVADAVDKVAESWPRERTVRAAVVATPPRVGQAAIDEAVRTFAAPAMSGPVLLAVGDRTAALAPAQFAPAITLAPDDGGALVPVFDEAALTAIVRTATAPLVRPPTEATWVLTGNTPTLRPSADGVAIDTAGAADLVISALTASDRTARLPTTVTPPTVTTAMVQNWGVREVVSSFDSAFPHNPDRTTNLTIAANTVNGTVVPPGGVFSLNGVLGERTAAKGYRMAPVIVNGRLTQGVGGGVSQISTVVYNLAWFAGAELTEHTAHSFYISRYPEGREATINWPNLDNKFTNTTPHAMLIQTWVSGRVVHGRIWSTKVYDVEAVHGPRTDIVPGKTITDNAPGCVPQPQMVPGFTVTVQRIIRQGGAVVKTENHRTVYKPEDKVICAGPST